MLRDMGTLVAGAFGIDVNSNRITSGAAIADNIIRRIQAKGYVPKGVCIYSLLNAPPGYHGTIETVSRACMPIG
jgi:hypothetical protein